MISRKVERKLNSFFAEGKHSALLVDGARQVGKTFIIEEFVEAHGEMPELLEAARNAWKDRRPLAKVFHDRPHSSDRGQVRQAL